MFPSRLECTLWAKLTHKPQEVRRSAGRTENFPRGCRRAAGLSRMEKTGAPEEVWEGAPGREPRGSAKPARGPPAAGRTNRRAHTCEAPTTFQALQPACSSSSSFSSVASSSHCNFPFRKFLNTSSLPMPPQSKGDRHRDGCVEPLDSSRFRRGPRESASKLKELGCRAPGKP